MLELVGGRARLAPVGGVRGEGPTKKHFGVFGAQGVHLAAANVVQLLLNNS